MNTRPRDTLSHDRARLMREFCTQPRTLSQILREFGGDQRARWTIYNLVKRGELVNLNAHLGRAVPGCYQVKGGQAVERPAVQQSERAAPALRFDMGADLQRAWGPAA